MASHVLYVFESTHVRSVLGYIYLLETNLTEPDSTSLTPDDYQPIVTLPLGIFWILLELSRKIPENVHR